MCFKPDAGLRRQADIETAARAAVGTERPSVDLVAGTDAAMIEDAVDEGRQPRHRELDLQIVVRAEGPLAREVAEPVVLHVAFRADARAAGTHPILRAWAERRRRVPLRLLRIVEHVGIDANFRDRQKRRKAQGAPLESGVLRRIRRRLCRGSSRQQQAKRAKTRGDAAGQSSYTFQLSSVSVCCWRTAQRQARAALSTGGTRCATEARGYTPPSRACR